MVLRHTALYQRPKTNEILLDQKVSSIPTAKMAYLYILTPTLSAQGKNFNKNLSSVRASVSDTESEMEIFINNA